MSLTSASDTIDFNQVCFEACNSEKRFMTFKRDPRFRIVLEHVERAQGEAYLQSILKRNPDFLWNHLEKFKTNDRIGSPHMETYDRVGSISPTTLRYVSCALDLLEQFQDLNHLNIVEIGGGYGGLCKILFDVWPNIQSYTICDIPIVNQLCAKYLKTFACWNRVVHVNGLTMESPLAHKDLVISNYAFSEINQDGRRLYEEYVLKDSPRGYMMINYFGQLEKEQLEQFVKSWASSAVWHEKPEESCAVNFVWKL